MLVNAHLLKSSTAFLHIYVRCTYYLFFPYHRRVSIHVSPGARFFFRQNKTKSNWMIILCGVRHLTQRSWFPSLSVETSSCSACSNLEEHTKRLLRYFCV